MDLLDAEIDTLTSLVDGMTVITSSDSHPGGDVFTSLDIIHVLLFLASGDHSGPTLGWRAFSKEVRTVSIGRPGLTCLSE